MTPHKKARKISKRTSEKPQVKSATPEGDPRFDNGPEIDLFRSEFFSHARLLFNYATSGEIAAQKAVADLMSQLERHCKFLVPENQPLGVPVGGNLIDNRSRLSIATQLHLTDRAWYAQCAADGMDILWDAAGEGSPEALNCLREEAERLTQKIAELDLA
jgi:hypothetical protein